MVGIYVRCQTHDTCMSILLDNRYNKHCLRLSLTDCDVRDPTNLQVHEYGSLSIHSTCAMFEQHDGLCLGVYIHWKSFLTCVLVSRVDYSQESDCHSVKDY